MKNIFETIIIALSFCPEGEITSNIRQKFAVILVQIFPFVEITKMTFPHLKDFLDHFYQSQKSNPIFDNCAFKTSVIISLSEIQIDDEIGEN